MAKNFQYQIYDRDGNYVDDFDPKLILSDVSFRAKLDSGLQGLSLDLAVPFDESGEGVLFDYMYRVDVYEYSEEHVDGVLIFRGVIDEYDLEYDANGDNVAISIVGPTALLKVGTYKDGASFEVIKTAQDPSVICEDIFSQINSLFPNIITVDIANFESVGQNVDYTFDNQNHLQAVQKTVELAGGGFNWFIRPDGTVTFFEPPTTATHSFDLEEHIETLKLNKSSNEIVNSVTVIYDSGASTVTAEDSASIAAYGKREKRYSESSTSDATTAQQIANDKLAQNKDPKVSVRIELNNSYDLTNIYPGETCRIEGVKNGSEVMAENMLIVETFRKPDSMSVVIEQSQDSFVDELQKIVEA